MKSQVGKKISSTVKSIWNHTIGLVVNPILNADWSNVRVSVYIRYFLMIVSIVNMFLTKAGMNPLPISEEEVYAIASDILTAIVFVVNTYKNNSTSEEAIKADRLMKELKAQSNELKKVIDTEQEN